MGFGLIFAGYFCFFCMRLIPIDIFGFFMMFCGFKKLKEYNNGFKRCESISLVCFAYSVLYGVFQILMLSGVLKITVSTQFTFVENLIYYSLLFLLHFHLYSGVKDIANFCDMPNTVIKASRCLSCAGVYYGFTFLLYVLKLMPIKAELFLVTLNSMFFALNLLMLIWLCMNVSLIFDCYKNIVTDEILEQEQQKIEKFQLRYGNKNKKTNK